MFKFFRENPGMWAVVGVALFGAVLVGWWVFGGASVEVGQFFAAEPSLSIAPQRCTETRTVVHGGGECPVLGGPRSGNTVVSCPGQCGDFASNAWNLAYGHVDVDPVSGLLYNAPGGSSVESHTTWEWWAAPANETGWCSADAPELSRIAPPPQRPPIPPSIRCINGSSGGVDYSAYPDCGPRYTTREIVEVECSPSPSPTFSATPVPTPTGIPITPLLCAPDSQTVVRGESAHVQAVGGDGRYNWTTTGSGVQEDGGADFVEYSYNGVGTKTITAYSASQTVGCRVIVEALPTPVPGVGAFTVTKLARNMTQGELAGPDTVRVNPGEVIQFVIIITPPSGTALGLVVIRDELPRGMSYRDGSTLVGGVPSGAQGIATGEGIYVNQSEPGGTLTVRWSAVADRTFDLAVGRQVLSSTVVVNALGDTETAVTSVDILGTGGGSGGPGPGPGGIPTGPDDAIVIAILVAATLSLLYTAHTRSPGFRRKEVEVVSRDQGPMDFRS